VFELRCLSVCLCRVVSCCVVCVVFVVFVVFAVCSVCVCCLLCLSCVCVVCAVLCCAAIPTTCEATQIAGLYHGPNILFVRSAKPKSRITTHNNSIDNIFWHGMYHMYWLYVELVCFLTMA